MSQNQSQGSGGYETRWTDDNVRKQLLAALDRLDPGERKQILDLITRTDEAADLPTIRPDWVAEGSATSGGAAPISSYSASGAGTSTGAALLNSIIDPWVSKEQQAWAEGRQAEALAIRAEREQWATNTLMQMQENSFRAMMEIARNLRS